MHWVPGVVSIAMALLVAAFTLMKDVPLTRMLNVGLAFEIVSCYGIALAEYIEPTRLNMQRVDGALVGGRLDGAVRRRHSHSSAEGRTGHARVRQRGPGRHRGHGRHGADGIPPDPFMFFLGIVLPYLARHDHGVRRRARRLHARQGGDRGARAGELPAGGATRPGWHGRGLACPPSSPRASRGDQADSNERCGAAAFGRRHEPIRAGGPRHGQPLIAAHRAALRLRRRRRRDVLLRHGASERPRPGDAGRAAWSAASRTGDLSAPPGVPVAGRGRVVRPRASRHQAGEPVRVPLRRRRRFRQGPRLRHRQGQTRRDGNRRRSS